MVNVIPDDTKRNKAKSADMSMKISKEVSSNETRKRALLDNITGLRKLRSFSKADAAIDIALRHFPRNANFVCERGWLRIEQKQFADAIFAFDEVLANDMHSEGALQGKIASLRLMGDFPKADEILKTAVFAHPKSLGILCERCWFWLDQLRYEEATAALADALKVPQKDDSIYLWQLFVLRTLGRLDEAENLFKEASLRFPDSLRLEVEKGWLMFHRADFEGAIVQFSRILAEAPKLGTVLQGKIASLRLMGALADAEYELQRADAELRASPGLISEAGWIAFARENFDVAEKAFREVVAMLPENSLDKINLAWTLARQGGDDALREAAQLCRDSLARAKSPEALGCLGFVSFRQQRFNDAERYFKESITIDPRRGHYADLVSLYTYMARYEDAERVLAEGTPVKPNEVGLHIEAANLHMQTEHWDKAVAAFRRAAQLDHSSVETLKGLALGLLASGKSILAEAVLREGITRMVPLRRVALHLALARVLTQRSEETDDRSLLNEALKQIYLTRQLRVATANSYFHEGVVRFKLKDYREAHAAFLLCQKMDAEQVQAAVNASRIRLLLTDQKTDKLITRIIGVSIALIMVLQLAILWYYRLKFGGGDDALITGVMITVLVPVCLGLMIVAFLLPSLTKLTVTGIEVELAEPRRVAESSGPKGEIGFGDALQMAGRTAL